MLWLIGSQPTGVVAFACCESHAVRIAQHLDLEAAPSVLTAPRYPGWCTWCGQDLHGGAEPWPAATLAITELADALITVGVVGPELDSDLSRAAELAPGLNWEPEAILLAVIRGF